MIPTKQTITFSYQQEGTSEGFNHLLHNVIPSGIIHGGELRLVGSEVTVSPSEMIINASTTDNKKLAVHANIEE
jgi:hypothetical protein